MYKYVCMTVKFTPPCSFSIPVYINNAITSSTEVKPRKQARDNEQVDRCSEPVSKQDTRSKTVWKLVGLFCNMMILPTTLGELLLLPKRASRFVFDDSKASIEIQILKY